MALKGLAEEWGHVGFAGGHDDAFDVLDGELADADGAQDGLAGIDDGAVGNVGFDDFVVGAGLEAEFEGELGGEDDAGCACVVDHGFGGLAVEGDIDPEDAALLAERDFLGEHGGFDFFEELDVGEEGASGAEVELGFGLGVEVGEGFLDFGVFGEVGVGLDRRVNEEAEGDDGLDELLALDGEAGAGDLMVFGVGILPVEVDLACE